MTTGIALLAAVIGYLSGSISFAILVTRFAAPDGKLSKITVSVPDSDLKIESDTLSATTVRLQLGARYGCLVSILDMVKAAVPALVFKLLIPRTALLFNCRRDGNRGSSSGPCFIVSKEAGAFPP